jgi:hypothetical protein
MSYMLGALAVGGGVMVVAITLACIVGQRRLGKHRGVPREVFIQAFTEAKVPDTVSAAVYDYYKSLVISRDFGIAPADTYRDTLHEGEEEILDDVRSLTRRLGLAVPSQEALVQAVMEIKTVRDMVLWLHSLRTGKAG